MNRTTALLIVVVAGLAFAAGALAGGGSSGPTPSTVAGGVPNGTWSKIRVGENTAVDMLDEIQALAIKALDDQDIDQAMFDQINNKLLSSATATPLGTYDVNVRTVRDARLGAMSGDWAVAIQMLDEIQ